MQIKQIEIYLVINPTTNNGTKINSIKVDIVAATIGGNKGTEYSFSNKKIVPSQLSIFVKPEIKKIFAIKSLTTTLTTEEA